MVFSFHSLILNQKFISMHTHYVDIQINNMFNSVCQTYGDTYECFRKSHLCSRQRYQIGESTWDFVHDD